MDRNLLRQGVSRDQRPFMVMTLWCRENNYQWVVSQDDKFFNFILAAYDKMYGRPKANGYFSGGVRFRDEIFLVNIPVIFGTLEIDPLDFIAIPQSTLEDLVKHQPDQVWEASYVVEDLYNFFRCSNPNKANDLTRLLQRKAGSHIEAAAMYLAMSQSQFETPMQSICLIVELSLKAALSHLGFSEIQMKKLGHNLTSLVQEVNRLRPSEEGEKLESICRSFPNVIEDRYSYIPMTRVQVGNYLHLAQFVAANMSMFIAGNIETGITDGGQRPPRVFWIYKTPRTNDE